MKGIVGRTSMNHMTQLCCLLDACLDGFDVDNGDPAVSYFKVNLTSICRENVTSSILFLIV